jgi:hypothetical protein
MVTYHVGVLVGVLLSAIGRTCFRGICAKSCEIRRWNRRDRGVVSFPGVDGVRGE